MVIIEIQPENEVVIKYSDVAPLVSKHISFLEIPIIDVPEPKAIIEITKSKVEEVLSSNENPSKLSVKVGLSKGQVMKIRKEYNAAIRHKSYGGLE